VDYARANEPEAHKLSKDLLIRDASFFRESLVFAELATTVIPNLVDGRDPGNPIRIWVPGCATGEEAYSIAILLAERMDATASVCDVQIFRTDVGADGLDGARSATYPESIAIDVAPERLRRFFAPEGHGYTLIKAIRRSLIFAAQNVVSDPPFSKLDL